MLLLQKCSICLLLALLVFSGRILSGDLEVDYANAGNMTSLSFSFMLQNSLQPHDYIKISLPFPLHSQLIPAYPATEGLSFPLGLTLTYQQVDQFSNILPNVSYAQILTETIDSSSYFIRFYGIDRKTITSIASNQWHYITFKLEDSGSFQYQKSSSILQIQMSTVSSVYANAMVYDDNLAFNYFQLSTTPSQLLFLTSTPYNYGSVGGELLIQNAYSLYLDLQMNLQTYHFTENLVLQFLISQEDTFKWNKSCSSVAKTTAPTIAMLDSSLYTCQVDTINNMVRVELTPSALTTQTSYRFTVDIINPPIVVKNVNIKVFAMKKHSSVIIGFGKHTNALSTNQIYVTYQEILLGWGLRPDALLPFDVRIFRGNAATPTYMPYNSLSAKFSVSRSTDPSVELRIVINIPSESSAFVLQSGFTNNLQTFSNKQVKCVVEYSSSVSKRQIGCTGIGQLKKGQIYEIGWKMFFPYDNYNASIDCSQFGTLAIYTIDKIDSKDNVFFLGRSDQYLQYLKNSSDYYVIGRNSSYIDYMKTFLNLNLVVLSTDFQQFLIKPEQIFITNRPQDSSNKNFNDVYLIRQNLAFINYISEFEDIYIAAKLKGNTDLVKGYHKNLLIAKTAPKNALTIKTSNSKDWTDFSDQKPLVSSTTTLIGNSPGKSLRKNISADQSLIFGLKAPYSDVTATNNTNNTEITNNWGLLIMMNPEIKLASGTQVVSDTNMKLQIQTRNQTQAYNKYTLISLRGSKSNDLQATFPTIAAKTYFGVSPFRIQQFSSIYADSKNFDFMIATIDGIDGPSNLISYNGFFLINGFTVIDAPLGTVSYQFINYASQIPMDGSQVPAMLRLKGTILDSENFDSLSIFFDKLTPFYENQYAGDIFCMNSDGSPYCKFSKGAQSSASKYNYNSMSRIDILLTSPNSQFNIFIPIKNDAKQTTTNFYLGYQKKDPTTKKKSLEYIEEMNEIVITTLPTIPSVGNYGPVVTSAKVGQTVSSLIIKAKIGNTLNKNNGSQIGGAFSYFSQWDYIKDSTISGWSLGKCHQISYLFYQTNYDEFLTGTTFSYSYKNMRGVVCLLDMGQNAGNEELNIANGYLPAQWGLKAPGYSAYSQNTGKLIDLKENSEDIGAALELTDPIILPQVGKNMINTVGQWVIPLPVQLSSRVKIVIQGDPPTTNLPFKASGTCQLFSAGKKTSFECTFSQSHTIISYTLVIKEDGIFTPNSNLSILHYGISTNNSYSDINVAVTCYSLVNNNNPTANDIIFKTTASYNWEPSDYIGKSSLTLSNFKQWTKNKAVIQSFNFTFNLINKGLHPFNRIRINLSQFYSDNQGSSVNPQCKIYDYSQNNLQKFSHDWDAIDSTQSLAKLQFWPKGTILNKNMTYIVKCINFLSTSSPIPISISGSVVNTSAAATNQLSSANQISLQGLSSLSATCSITLTKYYSVPSSQMQMLFTIISPGITLDSILYLNFPSYYANGLGANIKCYATNEIYCVVTDRHLIIRYMGVYSSGTSFIITVAGVMKPINYNSGTFSFIVDTDDDTTLVQAAGTFTDSVGSTVIIQNFPTFEIYSLNQSSSYLREQAITIVADFYLPSSLSDIKVGQSLFLVFPAIFADVLRFLEPTCVLNIKDNTLKNYISSCTVKGMKIKMPFLNDLVLGSTYTLTITNIINPTNPSAHTYRYSFQISSIDESLIAAKSYSPQCNYIMPIFIVNPVRKSLNYFTISNGLISELVTLTNIQSEQVYISSSSTLNESQYQRNVYLQPLNSLNSIPSSLNLLAGTNPFAIRFTALTQGVNYVYFTKSGDGNFYSNLPPLEITTNKNTFIPLSFTENSFQLPVVLVGTEYIITVSLPSSLYPMSQVQFSVGLTPSVGLSLKTDSNIISFYPQKIAVSVKLFVNDETLWKEGTTANITFTSTGHTTYSDGAIVSLTAISSTSTSMNSPSITLKTKNNGLKSYSFNIGCSQHGRMLYHISRKFSYNLTACSLNISSIDYWSEQSSIAGLRVSENYYQCSDIIGKVNLLSNIAQQLLISDLQASTDYKISAYCQSMVGQTSELNNLDFSTLQNGGTVSHMDFLFESQLSISQKIKLVCALALSFKVGYQKVSTYDGYYCSELLNRRRLQSTTSSLRRQIVSSTISTQTVYFGINTGLNSDDSRQNILQSSLNTTLKDQINNQVTGLPNLNTYKTNQISYVGSNDFSSSYSLSVDSSLKISNIMLSHDGLVYVIAGTQSQWTRVPTISEIKKGSGPSGLPPVFYQVLTYRQGVQTNLLWENLPQNTLSLYLLASDNNPFDTAHFGSIHSETITRNNNNWQTSLLPCGILLLLVIIM